ncbi:hypothetical protein F5X96DRAFT_695683 [Biscogniauxia mediterranea]|nr:hypothetical protein F5X96DRAFT_695683 [Biscogniauxia mediterranea]
MVSRQAPTRKLSSTLNLEGRQHAALRGNPKSLVLTSEEWRNINQRIRMTVDTVLSRSYVLDGMGPGRWELHTNLGVALLAEVIVRPLKTPCSLADPKLMAKLRAMASDVTHQEFRYTYEGGKVWFRFKMIDLEIAMKPIEEAVIEGDQRKPVENDEQTEDS